MRNLVFLFLAFVIFSSCEREESIIKKKAEVKFSPLIEEDKHKSSSIGRPDDIPVFVKDLTLIATHESGEEVEEEYIFNDNLEPGNILISPYVGANHFKAYTNPYSFPDFSQVNGEGQNGVGVGRCDNIEEKVSQLRKLNPHAKFYGETDYFVQYGVENNLFMEMFTDNGRLIVTVEFEDPEMANEYIAKVCFSNLSSWTWTAFVLNQEYSAGWFYLSNENAVDGFVPGLIISLYRRGDNTLVKREKIHEDYFEELMVYAGKDRHVKIELSKDWYLIKTQINGTFKFHWEEEDSDLILK